MGPSRHRHDRGGPETEPDVGDSRENIETVIAFVGVFATADSEIDGPAFNPAGQMFVEGLLSGLASAGLPADMLLGVAPMAAFPRGTRLFSGARRMTTVSGRPVRFLPFVNVQPLKWLTVGLSVLAALAAWSWRHRDKRRLVHCFNLSMPPGLFIWLVARLTRTRTLVSVCDIVTPGGVAPRTLFRKLDLALHRWLLPRFDGWMVVSQAIADDFLPGRRVCLIEGGVMPEPFAGMPVHCCTRGTSEVFRIVLAGSLEAFNGVELALEAMAYLPEGHQLIVAGKGSLAERAKESAVRNASIVYRGFLDFTDVLELYRSADLLLNLRRTRAIDTRYFFPSKLMELLASGTPVLSTCTGHVEEEYGDVLYLLRDETAQAVAQRIAEIVRIPVQARRALGAKAREFMLAEKTWQKQGKRLAHYIHTEVLT